MTADHSRHMAHALRLGRRGMGQVWPNPAVGCVIVNDSRVVGRGWTQPGGRPHAETQALADAGPRARGATAYVTLEPCAHHGQTPPCTDALIRAGISHVVAAVQDNDPRVSGKGFKQLRDAGIDLTTGVESEQALRDHAGFFLKTDAARPWVTLKLALSCDGRIATATGESQWITCAASRRAVHALRACHDAVMVGAGTARADDPMLTVRGFGDIRQPVRVVVSKNLDLPMDSKLMHSASDVPLWLCHGSEARQDVLSHWRKAGAVALQCGVHAGRIDVGKMLEMLAKQGLTRVFCEGGGQLAASLLAAGLVDELHVFSAGLALGAEGYPALGPLGIDQLAQAPRFDLRKVQRSGTDVYHVWQRK